jgi:hypothetical protein
VTVEFPDELLTALRADPEDVKKELRMNAAAVWYEQGRISQEIAAHMAGLCREDFLLALASMKKNSFHVDFNELNKELALD